MGTRCPSCELEPDLVVPHRQIRYCLRCDIDLNAVAPTGVQTGGEVATVATGSGYAPDRTVPMPTVEPPDDDHDQP